MAKSKNSKILPEIEISIKVGGIEKVSFITDTTGNSTAEDASEEIIAIVGERPMREERR